MAGKTKRLAKAVAALAATALVQKGVEKAMKSRPVRKKAVELKKLVGKRARAAGKAAGKQAQATGKAAGKRVRQLVNAVR